MLLPPFPRSLLYNRIPVTSMARFFSCCSLSFLLSEMKVFISVRGNTLWRAAIRKSEKSLNTRKQKRKSLDKQKSPLLRANLDFEAMTVWEVSIHHSSPHRCLQVSKKKVEFYFSIRKAQFHSWLFTDLLPPWQPRYLLRIPGQSSAARS